MVRPRLDGEGLPAFDGAHDPSVVDAVREAQAAHAAWHERHDTPGQAERRRLAELTHEQSIARVQATALAAARVEAARVLLPALRTAAATGGRRAIAAALDELARALEGP